MPPGDAATQPGPGAVRLSVKMHRFRRRFPPLTRDTAAARRRPADRDRGRDRRRRSRRPVPGVRARPARHQGHLLDTLKHPGGQCTELYPDKPIYDIPALPVCGAQELVDRLMQQIKPFDPEFHFGEEVVVPAPRRRPVRLGTSAGTRVRCRRDRHRRGRRLVPAAPPRRRRLRGVRGPADPLPGPARRPFPRPAAGDLRRRRLGARLGARLPRRPASLVLVHRRAEFRAAPASVARMQELVAAGACASSRAPPAALRLEAAA